MPATADALARATDALAAAFDGGAPVELTADGAAPAGFELSLIDPGTSATDEAVVSMLRRKDRPVIVAANKVDDMVQEADAATLWSLGFGYPYPVSAVHGRGVADLLDAALEALPDGPVREALTRFE